jgi:hypothetical protein
MDESLAHPQSVPATKELVGFVPLGSESVMCYGGVDKVCRFGRYL